MQQKHRGVVENKTATSTTKRNPKTTSTLTPSTSCYISHNNNFRFNCKHTLIINSTYINPSFTREKRNSIFPIEKIYRGRRIFHDICLILELNSPMIKVFSVWAFLQRSSHRETVSYKTD